MKPKTMVKLTIGPDSPRHQG